jgi:hypothetical protein
VSRVDELFHGSRETSLRRKHPRRHPPRALSRIGGRNLWGVG